MRLLFPLVCFLFSQQQLLAQAPPAAITCADLHLIPAPRECVSVEAIPIGGLGFFVAAAGPKTGLRPKT